MTKKQKLYLKIMSGSKNVRFEDFVTIMLAFGFIQDRVGGSHRIFKHPAIPDLLSIQPTKNGQAKPYQMHQFLSLVGEYDLNMRDDEINL